MPVLGIASVPTPPLQLPVLAPNVPGEDVAGVAELRARSREVVAGLPVADVLVLLGAGTALASGEVHVRAVTSLHGFGVHGADHELPAWGPIGPVSGLVESDDDLGASLSVLASLCAEVGRREPLLPVTLPVGADAPVVRDLVDGVLASLPSGISVAVLAAGDLATTLTARSAGYLVEDARDVEAAVVSALRDDRPADLAAIGPVEAARVGASGWGPLLAAQHLAVAAGLRLQVEAHTDVRGIGGVITTTVGS